MFSIWVVFLVLKKISFLWLYKESICKIHNLKIRLYIEMVEVLNFGKLKKWQYPEIRTTDVNFKKFGLSFRRSHTNSTTTI